MTARETIVLAIHNLAPNLPVEGVHKSAIVVECWRLNVPLFGLHGFNEYPDSNRVLMETPKMLREGWLERPATNRYCLTAKGRALAGEICRRQAKAS